MTTTSEIYQQFRREMEAAGYYVEDYQGRFFYSGPAVKISRGEFQDVCRQTTVRLQTDDLGLGLVVYPVTNAPAPD